MSAERRAKVGFLFMITWKTNVCWHWLEDSQSVFSQRLSNGENFFLACKLKKHKYGGESTEGESIPLFNRPSVFRHFQGCWLLITSLFLLPETQSKTSVDKELFKTYSCSVVLYLASFFSPAEFRGFFVGNGQWKPDRPWTGQMALLLPPALSVCVWA